MISVPGVPLSAGLTMTFGTKRGAGALLITAGQVCMLGLTREEPLDTYGLKFGINMKRCVHRPVIISRQPLVSLAFAANIIFQDPAHPLESAHRIHQAPETSGQDNS
jgi:hypothetical protein